MKPIADDSRYDVEKVKVALIDVSRGVVVRPLGVMTLAGADDFVRQYGRTNYPIRVYASNDRERRFEDEVKAFSRFIQGI